MASRCGQAAPGLAAAPEMCSAAVTRRVGETGSEGCHSAASQVGDHGGQSFVGEIGLGPAGFEHPLDTGTVSRASRSAGAHQHYRGGRDTVPRALVRSGVGQQPHQSSSRPARTPARPHGARWRPPASPPPPRSCWAGGRPAHNPAFETAATSLRSAKPRAKRVTLAGAGGRDHRRQTDENRLLRALGQREDRRRLYLGVAEAEPGRSLAAASTRATPSSSCRAGAPAGTWPTAAGRPRAAAARAALPPLRAAPSPGSAAPPFAPAPWRRPPGGG